MSELQRDILHRIGNTSLLALRNIVPENGARILLKLENENPTGSMKDRMALAMIEPAEAGPSPGPGRRSFCRDLPRRQCRRRFAISRGTRTSRDHCHRHV